MVSVFWSIDLLSHLKAILTFGWWGRICRFGVVASVHNIESCECVLQLGARRLRLLGCCGPVQNYCIMTRRLRSIALESLSLDVRARPRNYQLTQTMRAVMGFESQRRLRCRSRCAEALMLHQTHTSHRMQPAPLVKHTLTFCARVSGTARHTFRGLQKEFLNNHF